MLLCLPPAFSHSCAAFPPFRSSQQPSQSACRPASFHLHLLEKNMPTAAFHKRQQEDESERLSLYIHAQHPPRLLFRREKEPSAAPDFQQISPSFSAAPRSRACNSLSLPSECQVFSQRWPALLDAHCPPRGRSHQRQPVTKMNSSEFKTLRGCAAGIPRPFPAFSGNMSSKSSHAASLIPSNLPGISAVLLEKGSLTSFSH